MPQLSDLEIKTIALILGPAVIAAIITGTVSIILSRRSARLENITGERSKWREQIREIAKGIQVEDRVLLSKSIHQLKLHLNAYGLPKPLSTKKPMFTHSQILWDTHIWVVIKELEELLDSGKSCNTRNPRNLNNLRKDCNLLEDYLSMLLKFDWERAKNELNKSLSLIAGWILFTVSVLGMSSWIAYDSSSNVSENGWLYALVNTVVYISTVVIVMTCITSVLKNFTVAVNKGVNRLADICVILYPVVVTTILMILFSWYVSGWLHKFSDGNMKFEGETIFILLVFLYVLGVALICGDAYRTLTYELNYIRSVRERYVEHYEVMEKDWKDEAKKRFKRG